MTCELWRDQIEGYIDGELEADHDAAVASHLRSCAACNVFAAGAIYLKRAVGQSGRRYQPSAQFRDQIVRSIGAQRGLNRAPWISLVLAAALVIVVAGAVVTFLLHSSRNDVIREIADINLNVTASANPVDVVSTDMHTVKPWFEGKLPFTFNLPELSGSPFTLVGGRVVYVHGEPCALLLFQYRLHRMSTIIGPASLFRGAGGEQALASGFHIVTSAKNGYAFATVGDASIDILRDIDQRVRAAQ